MTIRNSLFYIILGFAILNLLLRIDGTMLWDEDEAAYAAFANRMLQTHDWLDISYFNAFGMHRKPPLHFWLIATGYRVFGVHEWVVRLPALLATLSTYLVMWIWGKRLFGKAVAEWSVMILSVSILVPTLGKISVLDAEMLFYETLAVFALRSVFLFPAERQHVFVFWLAVALGVLLKGPPILILTGGMFVFLYFLHPDKKYLLLLKSWIGLPLALAPLLVWAYASWQHDGGVLVSFLWDWYVMKRVGGSNAVNVTWTGPPGYHFVVLLVCFLWVIPYLFPALADLYQRFKLRESNALFFVAWLLFGWVFYEMVRSKLPAYSIAAQPALAILIAQQMVKHQSNIPNYLYKQWIRNTAIFQLLFVLILATAIGYFAMTVFGPDGFRASMPVITVCWAFALCSTIFYYANKPFAAQATAVAGGAMFMLSVWVMLMPLIEHSRDATRRAVQTALKLAGGRTKNLIINANPGANLPSIYFYGEQNGFAVSSGGENGVRADEVMRSTTPTVFITDSINAAPLLPILAEKGLKTTEIRVFLIDRNRKSSYYVFTNF